MIRGLVINDSIFLERSVDRVIANHYCDNEEKRNELLEWLLSTDRIIFSNKVQLFRLILERHNKEFIKKHPDIFKDIISVIEERNILAHYQLDTSAEGINKIDENKFVLLKYKTSPEEIVFDRYRKDKILKLIAKCIKDINELLQ